MRGKHTAIMLALAGLLASLITFVSSGTASASSSYDGLIQPTDRILVSGSQNGNTKVFDVTYKIRSVLAQCNAAASSSLESAIQNGGHWLVMQEDSRAYVRWSANPSTYASFFMLDGTTPALGTSPGMFSVARIDWVGGTDYLGCGYYPNLNRGHDDALLNVGSTPLGVLFSTFPTTYPSGYEGEAIPASEPHARYVAMGDSFSSGEGNAPFEAGTDANSVNECHRSSQAYPRLLESDSSLNLGSTVFVACSGATTDHVLNGGSGLGNWNEGPQIAALTQDTQVVTITIGGNDIGFKAFATACTVTSCDFATTAYSNIHNQITGVLPGKLADVYEAIDDATSSTADIYVIGYPQITPAEMPTGMNSACYPFNGGDTNPDPALNDGATAYAVVSELNSVIHQAVTDLGSTKFHFVDPNMAGSPFIGHDWCKQDRYFDVITFNNTEYSYHPNEGGQEAYAAVVKGEMS